ncbi:uncharacterized protein LOC131301001 [Rhododendron vialii]|uniref:uncharacterized protein LOC131301001 n=1 Tax=Rhododendron vialii TaxID=182163 RepID=UPI00265DAB4B|nr:uncharacterized protein LOC131301001 [Rhododendron vialii]
MWNKIVHLVDGFYYTTMFILEKLINCCFVLLGLFQMGKFGDAFILEKELEMQCIEIQRLHSKNQRLYHDEKYLQHQLHLRELAFDDLHKEQGKRTNAVIQKALEVVARVRTTKDELALARDAASRHLEENIALKKALEEAQKQLGEGISGDH